MTRTDPTRMVVGGVEYVTTTMACARFLLDKLDEHGEPYQDVTPVIMRDWKRRGLIHAIFDPDGQPIRLDGENVFEWDEVSAAEFATRMSQAGRKRPA